MKKLAPVLALLTSVFALVPAAEAVAPTGGKGFIVFASARPYQATPGGMIVNPATEDESKIWKVSGDFINAPATQITFGSTRHSHPAISPDGTKVAYAKADAAGGGAIPKDIWVANIPTSSLDPVVEINLTNGAGANSDEDRPAWSPDGTKIAFGMKDFGAATNEAKAESDVMIVPAAGGAITPFQASNTFSEDKPVYSPNGDFIYYSFEFGPVFTNPPSDADILRKSTAGGVQSPQPIITSTGNDWQPNLSHDGARLCYSRGLVGATDVNVASATQANTGIDTLETGAGDDFNCVWAGDNSRIVYTEGGFSSGVLRSFAFPAGGGNTTISDSSNDFDGNADWWVNPTPVCQDGTAKVAKNGVVEIPLTCTDQFGGESNLDITSQPANGFIGSISDNQSVFYTPKADFQGADTFTFTGSDGTTTSKVATINITVGEPGGGGGGADTTKPTLSRVAVKGKTLSLTLSERSSLRVVVEKAGKGRKVGKRCRKQTRKNSKKKKCTLYKRVKTINKSGLSGSVKISLGKLKKGTYRVSIVATDGAGNKSATRRIKFKVRK